MLPLSAFIAQLPHVEAPLPLSNEPHGVTFVPKEDPRFVEPILSELLPLQAGLTSVVVLSSPAAVGKSTVARHIAYTTQAPLWDMAGVGVSTGSFTGVIVRAFGASAAVDVFQRLEQGTMLIVLDALDETDLLSGAEDFESFLTDLRHYCEQPRPRPCLVLMARPDTSVLISVALEERSIPYAHYQIDFFDLPSAELYVRKALGVRGRTSPVYQEARDLLFNYMYQLLAPAEVDPWRDHDVRAFLGYAPVLEAIAKYLDEPNPKTSVNLLESEQESLRRGGGHVAWSLLTRIIDYLLLREQREKVVPALKSALGTVATRIGWNSWDDLFRPDEQCQRVLLSILELRRQRSFVEGLPPELRAPYEERIEATLPNHPFFGAKGRFANVVFQEYLYARYLLGAEPLRSAVRQRLRRPDYLPTPLLGHFILSMAPLVEAESLIDGADVGFLYESLTARAEKEGEIQFGLWPDRERETLRAAVYGG